MQITKRATDAGASVALAVALVLAGGLPAVASTAESEFESEQAAPYISETALESLSSGADASPDETQARVAVIPIITAVILAGGAAYAMGEKAALRCYYAGLRNGEWQNIKWHARAVALGMIGPVGGSIFITGFENKFYSLV